MTTLNLKFSVFPLPHKKPLCRLVLNDEEIYDGPVLEIFNIKVSENYNILNIIHYNKNQSDTIIDDTGKIINDLGFNLDEVSLETLKFDSVYLNYQPFIMETYNKDKNIIRNNLYFGYNGQYQLNFYGDPNKQKYYQLWINEEQSNFNQQLENNQFVRFGEKVDVDSNLNITIHDLARLVNESENN